MNDIGYEKLDYKGSYAYNTVMGCTKEQLRYRRGYTQGAIDYHKKENNTSQIKFFTDELNLIDKRLKLKGVREK